MINIGLIKDFFVEAEDKGCSVIYTKMWYILSSKIHVNYKPEDDCLPSVFISFASYTKIDDTIEAIKSRFLRHNIEYYYKCVDSDFDVEFQRSSIHKVSTYYHHFSVIG